MLIQFVHFGRLTYTARFVKNAAPPFWPHKFGFLFETSGSPQQNDVLRNFFLRHLKKVLRDFTNVFFFSPIDNFLFLRQNTARVAFPQTLKCFGTGIRNSIVFRTILIISSIKSNASVVQAPIRVFIIFTTKKDASVSNGSRCIT